MCCVGWGNTVRIWVVDFSIALVKQCSPDRKPVRMCSREGSGKI